MLGTEKNLAVFYNQIVEIFSKYTKIDPSHRKGGTPMGHHFICKSELDIHSKLHNLGLSEKHLYPNC